MTPPSAQVLLIFPGGGGSAVPSALAAEHPAPPVPPWAGRLFVRPSVRPSAAVGLGTSPASPVTDVFPTPPAGSRSLGTNAASSYKPALLGDTPCTFSSVIPLVILCFLPGT